MTKRTNKGMEERERKEGWREVKKQGPRQDINDIVCLPHVECIGYRQ